MGDTLICLSKYIPVICYQCEKTYDKRTDSIKQWSGLCIACSNKKNRNLPEVNAKIAKASSVRLLAQGGIPNARKFDGSVRGENHWNWRGGVTSDRRLAMATPRYRKWRTSVFVRDDYTCQHCGVRGGPLQADHIKPWSLFKSLRYVVSNGRALCKPCHLKTSTWGRRIDNHLKVAA